MRPAACCDAPGEVRRDTSNGGCGRRGAAAAERRPPRRPPITAGARQAARNASMAVETSAAGKRGNAVPQEAGGKLIEPMPAPRQACGSAGPDTTKACAMRQPRRPPRQLKAHRARALRSVAGTRALTSRAMRLAPTTVVVRQAVMAPFGVQQPEHGCCGRRGCRRQRRGLQRRLRSKGACADNLAGDHCQRRPRTAFRRRDGAGAHTARVLRNRHRDMRTGHGSSKLVFLFNGRRAWSFRLVKARRPRRCWTRLPRCRGRGATQARGQSASQTTFGSKSLELDKCLPGGLLCNGSNVCGRRASSLARGPCEYEPTEGRLIWRFLGGATLLLVLPLLPTAATSRWAPGSSTPGPSSAPPRRGGGGGCGWVPALCGCRARRLCTVHGVDTALRCVVAARTFGRRLQRDRRGRPAFPDPWLRVRAPWPGEGARCEGGLKEPMRESRPLPGHSFPRVRLRKPLGELDRLALCAARARFRSSGPPDKLDWQRAPATM